MSHTAEAYAWRLRVHGKSTPRKFLLVRIAGMTSDDTMSCYAKVATLAAYLDIDPRRTKEYLSDLAADGNVSVLERTHPDGRQRDSRIFMHGPWDAFGGTGEPFAEIELPKSSKPMDPTPSIEVTPEMRQELWRRYTEYAEEFGRFPDGTPRCRWRLGSRAHSIVCWYGVGNLVVHTGRAASVLEVTDTDHKNKPVPEQVRLRYLDDSTESDWVRVEDLTEPFEENPSSEGGDENSTPGGTESSPQGGTESSPQGGTESSPLESSSEAKRESSSSGGTQGSGKEEEEPPSARTTGTTPLELVLAATDATEAEARALVEVLRPEAKKSLGGFIRTLATRGDLDHRLWLLRRERAPQPRMGASEATGPDAVCSEHREPLDCPVCAVLHPRMAQLLLNKFGPVRRPDLAARLAPADTPA
ncbi:hypothetical protein [Nocardiopsis flavescens]